MAERHTFEDMRTPGWREEHARRYLATDGAEGQSWNGMPALLLTTKGRRSSEPRLSPLVYGRDGDRYLIVASLGGAPTHPQWYHNLVANPEVELQVGAERFRARARTATPAEKPALWSVMTGVFPGYDQYQSKTARDIPVIILERI